MKQHGEDPTGDAGEPSGDKQDSWREAEAHWATVRESVASAYRSRSGAAPEEERFRDAIGTLGSTLTSSIQALGDAMSDPEVRSEVKEAAADLVAAIGQTFSQLGDELRKSRSKS